ncbi:MAG: DUF4290 domain-containing protein [Bacteroidales bacterium]
MDYNTQRKHLALPEYGRHIQKLVDELLEVEDRDERSKKAKGIITVMGNMNPHLRDINDFKHKLWDHLHIMADFKLDIDSPYPKPDMEVIFEKPKPVPYPQHPVKHKHYGRSIIQMIKKAVEMEEGEEKEALTSLVANHMKKSYVMWNKEFVTDEDIIRDMKELSNGKLTVAPDFKFNEIREMTAQRGRKKFQPRKKQ